MSAHGTFPSSSKPAAKEAKYWFGENGVYWFVSNFLRSSCWHSVGLCTQDSDHLTNSGVLLRCYSERLPSQRLTPQRKFALVLAETSFNDSLSEKPRPWSYLAKTKIRLPFAPSSTGAVTSDFREGTKTSARPKCLTQVSHWPSCRWPQCLRPAQAAGGTMLPTGCPAVRGAWLWLCWLLHRHPPTWIRTWFLSSLTSLNNALMRCKLRSKWYQRTHTACKRFFLKL